MPSAHSRKSSGHHNHNPNNEHQPSSPAKHHRNKTTPTLLRLPSTASSAGASTSPRSRRATDPPTPTLTPSLVSTSSATSPSYFSPQPAASGKEARSPATRRPPASFSGHGIDTSKGPPITLITRGTVDIARRSQKPTDFAFAQQQLLQLGLVPPGVTSPRRRDSSADSSHRHHNTPPTQTQTPTLSRQPSAASDSRHRPMESSVDGSSEYDSGLLSQSEDARPHQNARGLSDRSNTDGEQGEDLFLNIAEDSPKESAVEPASRLDRYRSRIAAARSSNRQSLPSNTFSSASTTPNASRLPSAIDTKAASQHRRASQLSTASIARAQREQSPLSPANPLETPRSRLLDLSSQPSRSNSRSKEQDSSPQYIAQYGRRRPSYPDTPPSRNQTYRPSNLQFSSSRDNPETPQVDQPAETGSRADGTDSIDSTGPAASVWDELDDLKSRIRRIELGGKIPATSAAVVSSASGERPRTANTSVTTASSSPQHQRKTNVNDTRLDESDDGHRPPKVHPLLREALQKAKQHISPSVFRVLDATASEALELAEMTGSAGPQGTLISASSIINGATLPDRHVRRKADNICRSLTELCISLSDPKVAVQSPALRSAVTTNSRRPSLQINGESPSIRQSIEPESNSINRSSPSRAMSRIEARRTSLLNGSPRDSSQEPPTPSQSQIPSRLGRAGTSLRTRRTGVDEDDDPTLRAPSRALTDFREIRASNKSSRFSREYTSREPMPELQPSPALQPTVSLRRPTVSGIPNESSLLSRDSNRRYNLDRQSSPAYEKQVSADFGGKSAQPYTSYSSKRASLTSSGGLGRAGSLNSRLRSAAVE
ncbi:hypothetical protein EJ04DRAFT_458776 [Polyplosphaeria fusca]|uniref:LPXTG-motif cell wall anchor domain protein n=1 Tax=Polyplosphaeria fusca TaxID=682080 RepID=A0A9P4R3N9_9PLEO|nr:hypothetical protein EJ04DRAFT_458776 [Polyplosphaeria fusca]